MSGTPWSCLRQPMDKQQESGSQPSDKKVFEFSVLDQPQALPSLPGLKAQPMCRVQGQSVTGLVPPGPLSLACG
jgi:hypothetical protein